MILILFFCLAGLYILESSTSLARSLGYFFDNPAAGFTLQQSLAVFSRAAMMLFMPILGFMADKQLFKIDLFFLYALLIPVLGLLIFNLTRSFWYKFLSFPLLSITETGSLISKSTLKSESFKLFSGSHFSRTAVDKSKREKFYKKNRFFLVVVFFAYLPLYLSWPVIMISLAEFSESRALVIGLSSWIVGIHTLAITLYIDPRLAYLGTDLPQAFYVYDTLVFVRFFSCLFSALLVILWIVSHGFQ